MVKRLDRIILRAADALNNTPAAFGVTELERLPDGTDREVPMREVDVSLLGEIADKFNLGAVQENEALRSQVKALTERIAAMTIQLPFDPRIIDATAFVNRIAKDEMLKLFSSVDENVSSIAKMLVEYKANDWPIVLDSPELSGAIQYLQHVKLISEDRAKQLTADATREEAYSAE